jgi:hypothetical protein
MLYETHTHTHTHTNIILPSHITEIANNKVCCKTHTHTHTYTHTHAQTNQKASKHALIPFIQPKNIVLSLPPTFQS